MKKVLFFIMFVNYFSFGQSKFELTKEGLNSVVTEMPGMTAEQLYLKTKEWIQINYIDPKEVLKSDVSNEMIRIRGYRENFYFIKTFIGKEYYSLFYLIEFNFKDGKYKFEFISDGIYFNNRPILSDEKNFFKKDGSIKKSFKEGYDSYIESLNSIYQSHNEYLLGKTITNKKDW